MGNNRSLVNTFGDRMFVGERLKEERARLGLSQAGMAERAGVSKKSQTNYELEHRAPDADYLARIAEFGVDVQYVLTGSPGIALAEDERELLRRYRAASAELRTAALAVLGATSGGRAPAAVEISGGEQGQIVAGTAHQEGLTINVGSQKRGKRK